MVTPRITPPDHCPVFACRDCGVEVRRKSPTHRYCEPCSAGRHAARHQKQSAGDARDRQRAEKSRTVIAGVQRNSTEALGIYWSAEMPVPDLAWFCRFAVPFTPAASKNYIYTPSAHGHVAMRRESRAARNLIEAEARREAAGRAVQGKVYLDILVQKPHHMGDAINVIDLVADGVKKGIGVDDRWFCLLRVDWQIVKTNPHIVIGIGQATREPQQACSHCGIIQFFAAFTKKKGNPNGIDRACKSCLNTGRQSRGDEHPAAKLDDARVAEILALAAAGVPKLQIARRYGISRSVVRGIVAGRAWSHVPRPE